MKNKDRKLFLQVEYTHLEESEFEEQLTHYTNEYLEEFADEIHYLKSRPEYSDVMQRELEPKMSDQHPYFQSLYRAIAKLSHPDKNNGNDEYFKRANSAYSTGNWVELIVISNELRIKLPEVPEDVYNEVMKCLESISSKLNQKKQTAAWVWGAGDKTPHLRQVIQDALGIDPELFEEWKRTKDDW
jgi:hypothetical protein